MSGRVIVTMRHARAMRVCRRIRPFFERHGLDVDDFFRNGIPAEELEATGDAQAIAVAEFARRGG